MQKNVDQLTAIQNYFQKRINTTCVSKGELVEVKNFSNSNRN